MARGRAVWTLLSGQVPPSSAPSPSPSPSPLPSSAAVFDDVDDGVVGTIGQLVVAGKQFAAGAVAGAVAKSCIAPLDRVKIIFQVSQERFTFRSALDRAVGIVKTEGALALFKGNLATVARYASGVLLLSRGTCVSATARDVLGMWLSVCRLPRQRRAVLWYPAHVFSSVQSVVSIKPRCIGFRPSVRSRENGRGRTGGYVVPSRTGMCGCGT